MFHKFKTTTYATLLLIGVFVLPYAGNVADVNAENYGCKGSKKAVRQCLKAVISERDATIAELVAKHERPKQEINNQEHNVIRMEERTAEDIEKEMIEMREIHEKMEAEELRNRLNDRPPSYEDHPQH